MRKEDCFEDSLGGEKGVRIFKRFVVGGAGVGEEEDFSGIHPLLMPLVLARLGSISIDQWDLIHMYRRQGSYHCCVGALCCGIFIWGIC